jgi:hypothetical protein
MKRNWIALENEAALPDENAHLRPTRLAPGPDGKIKHALSQIWLQQDFADVGSREHSALDD